MTPLPRKWIAYALVLIATNFVACTQNPLAGSQPPVFPLNTVQIQQDTFESIWSQMAENDLVGNTDKSTWDDVYEEYASKVTEPQSPENFHQLMEEMIQEMPNSGVNLMSRQDRINNSVAATPNKRNIGAFTGIRDGEDEERRLIILHIMPNSAAAIAGLSPHDAILEIDGQPVLPNQGQAAQQALRIDAEQELQLLVQNPSGDKRMIMVRQGGEPPQASPVVTRVLQNTDYLYIQYPPNESRDSISEFASAIDRFRLRNSPEKGIIIDTRLMIGQRQSSILQFTPLLTDGILLNRIEDGRTNEINIEGVASGLQASDGVPIVIILGRDTAGVGELFTAALQDNERALVIGQASGGRVEEFESGYLPNGSQLLLPTTAIITPKEQRNIGQMGIEPDFIIDIDWDSFSSGSDPVIDEAVDLLDEISGRNNN